MLPPVKVKWGKELFKDVELNTDEEPVVFRAQLFALTGVQPDRQKIMLKGMTLKPDTWDNVKLKDVSPGAGAAHSGLFSSASSAIVSVLL